MDPIEQENALLEQRIAELEARLSQPEVAATPAGGSLTNALATGTGGLINLGDILTFGQLSKGIAAVPAIGRDIYGLATGAAPQDYYTEELAKVNALKNLYAQQREAEGLGGLETALSFMAPVPGGKAEAFTSLAKPLQSAGLGLTAYGGSELGEYATGSPGGAIAGALAAPLSLSLGKAGIKAIAPSVEEAGKGLQRSALGIRQSDYTKAAKNQIIESLPGDFETQLKSSADKLIENKTLGTSTNPDVLYSNLRDAKESTEAAIQGVLQEVDKTRKTGIIPRLDKTLEWIQTKAPATEVKYYKEKVNEFLKALKEQGQGSLVYLNQQKKAIGENWKQSPETDPTFWRRFYTDVKDTIEEYAPEVKQLNKDKRDLLVVEPVIERAKRAAEKPMTPQDLTRALLYTTGGAGLPGAAYLTGSPVLGTVLAGGLALAGTKPGQSLLGRALTATGRAGQALEPSLLQTTPRTIRDATSEMLSKEQFVAQQPYLHGTSEAGLKAIEEAQAFIPKTINYSVLGEGTVYGAKKNSWWFDPDKAAAGRMWELPNQVPIYLKPEANVAKINNDKDWEKLASKLNMTGDELASALYFEPGASKAKVQQAKAIKQKLIDSGVDAIEIGKQPDWIKSQAVQELENKYIDIYYKFLQKGDTVFNDANIAKRLPVALLDKLRGVVGFKKYEFGDDQLAIINHKVAEPAEYAYKRLLKSDPSKLLRMTPEEKELLPPAIKEQAARLGYFGARAMPQEQTGDRIVFPGAETATAAPIASDAEQGVIYEDASDAVSRIRNTLRENQGSDAFLGGKAIDETELDALLKANDIGMLIDNKTFIPGSIPPANIDLSTAREIKFNVKRSSVEPTTAENATTTPAPAIDDAAYEAENTMLEQRIMELEKKYNAPVEAKVGKQNISIPTGEQYAPADLVKAVIKVESAGKPDAVSSKGARGLMQIMPATAKYLGIDANDPDENVEGGSRYLAQQIKRFGNYELGLAAYNWGPENVKRAISKIEADGKRPTWANVKAYVKVPRETRQYVDKVLSLI